MRLISIIAILCIAVCAFAAEVWKPIGHWTSGNNQALTILNTDTFIAPSNPWGVKYAVQKIDKAIPMYFTIIGMPVDESKYKQVPIAFMVSKTATGSNRVYSKSPMNYLAIMAVNCRWTIELHKITK